jgi:hypothetical protein
MAAPSGQVEAIPKLRRSTDVSGPACVVLLPCSFESGGGFVAESFLCQCPVGRQTNCPCSSRWAGQLSRKAGRLKLARTTTKLAATRLPARRSMLVIAFGEMTARGQ